MAKLKKIQEESSTAEVVVTEATPEVETAKEVKFPEVAKTGRFQAVKVGALYVVYNPDACRVSGLVSFEEARNIVLRQNTAAQIKG